MTKASIVFAVPDFLPLIDVAKEAELAGFDRIWTTETPGRDSLVRALTFGLNTDSIGIGTGIAYAFTRAPLAMAAAAADIYDALGGRFSLGVGAGTQGMRSRWYGISDFDHAASRLEEYTVILREAWRSAKVFHHDGRFYSGSYGEMDGERSSVPIWGSGINSTMLKISARSCDGVAVHPLGSSITYLDGVVLPAIAEGVQAIGRSPDLALWRITSIDDDDEVARSQARRGLAFYFSTPSYGNAAVQTGWGDVARQVREMYGELGPQWDSISDLIPDEMVNEFCLVGTTRSVRDEWDLLREQYERRGVTEVVFQTAVGSSKSETLDNLRSIVAALGPRNYSSL